MKAEILSLRIIHDGWTKFGLAKVRLADGTEVEREIEDHGNSVGVLPYDPERRVATLVRELRVPPLYVSGEQSQLEAPAGLIDDGSPDENARREVLEETGLRLHDLEHVGTTYSCAGISTEQIHLFLAPIAPPIARPVAAAPRASTRTSRWWRCPSLTSPEWPRRGN